jgi:hypothetical protein
MTVWIDATFIPEGDASTGTKDSPVEYRILSADNIGEYSMPAAVTFRRASNLAGVDSQVDYNTGSPIEQQFEIPAVFYIYEPPISDALIDINVEFYRDWVVYSGTRNTPVIYTTGFNAVSGSLNKYVAFTSGHQYVTFNDVPVYMEYKSSAVDKIDNRVNYTNFSGNVGASGIPIASFDGAYNYWAEFFLSTISNTSLGGLDRLVDISFAGWVPESIPFDVFSSDEGYSFGFEYEVTVSAGGLLPHYLDVISSDLTTSGINLNIICSLVEMADQPFEVESILGRIRYINTDIYSVVEDTAGLTMDIELFSIKFDNFSPTIGEFNNSDTFISVDVLDDTCPISVSGTYFMVDDQRVPVTLSGIADGYRMYYDPTDDFASLQGTTVITAHAENECGSTLEQDYYLTFGYFVKFLNEGLMSYGFNNKVAVRITAEDYASCPQLSGLAWEFESKNYFNSDLGASIVGRIYVLDNKDMSAEIYPVSPAYFYGKDFRVVVTAKDFAGNEMEPLVLIYKIENKP